MHSASRRTPRFPLEGRRGAVAYRRELRYPPNMANQRARNLRRNMTDAEKALWRVLRGKQLEGWRFRRQHPLGPYIVDFICLEKKLVVEVDGGHHGEDEHAAHDARRDEWIQSRGYQVLRFWNADVVRDPHEVAHHIYLVLTQS